jgi:hypothetical protein
MVHERSGGRRIATAVGREASAMLAGALGAGRREEGGGEVQSAQ